MYRCYYAGIGKMNMRERLFAEFEWSCDGLHAEGTAIVSNTCVWLPLRRCFRENMVEWDWFREIIHL